MKQDFEISTDTSRLDIEMIHSFLSEESYWANKRTLEQTKTAIENSICFGVYQGEEQVGFARVVTDKATFEDPNQLSVGMDYVLVNGVPVISDGKMTNALPGKVLRGPGWKK